VITDGASLDTDDGQEDTMKRFQMFPATALLLAACSGNAVDLGDGPLSEPPPSPAAGEVSIQCEDGIDCQDGVCASCFLETCFCDSSAEVARGGCIAAGATATEPVVSDDGSAFAFAACLQDGRCRSYYWTAAGGRQVIPSTGSDNARPTSMSADGQLVLLSLVPGFEFPQSINTPSGEIVIIPPPPIDPSTFEARVYRAGGSVMGTGLPSSMPGLGGDTYPVKLSAGGIVVGLTWAENDSQQLARWTEAGGLEPLASFPVTPLDGRFPTKWLSTVGIKGMTPDASTIVGVQGGQALLWTDAGGLQVDLGPVPEDALLMGISRDGTTLVGSMNEDVGSIAFHWRRTQDSLTRLGTAVGWGESATVYVADDGSVVGGLLDLGNEGNYPFRWTEQSGVAEPLAQHAAFDFPLPFVSGDGRVIGDGPNRQSYYSFSSPRRDRPEPPRRFDGGPISAVSHDGQATVGIGRCGGVETVYRETITWAE
jgi:hypothetical protein